jgi:hypothetical protein
MVSLCFAKGNEFSHSVRTSQSVVVVDDKQCENRKGILVLLHSLVVFRRTGKVSLLGSNVFANLAHSQNNVTWYSYKEYMFIPGT